jgi:hypothetical protein
MQLCTVYKFRRLIDSPSSVCVDRSASRLRNAAIARANTTPVLVLRNGGGITAGCYVHVCDADWAWLIPWASFDACVLLPACTCEL